MESQLKKRITKRLQDSVCLAPLLSELPDCRVRELTWHIQQALAILDEKPVERMTPQEMELLHKALRIAFTGRNLAKELGFTPSTIYGWKKHKYRPTRNNIEVLTKYVRENSAL